MDIVDQHLLRPDRRAIGIGQEVSADSVVDHRFHVGRLAGEKTADIGIMRGVMVHAIDEKSQLSIGPFDAIRVEFTVKILGLSVLMSALFVIDK